MPLLKEVLTWTFCLYTHTHFTCHTYKEVWFLRHCGFIVSFFLLTQDRKHWLSILSFSVICLIKPSHLQPWPNMPQTNIWNLDQTNPLISTSLVSLNCQHDGFTSLLFLHSYCWLQSKKSFCLKLSLSIKVSARMLTITQRQIPHCNSWHF